MLVWGSTPFTFGRAENPSASDCFRRPSLVPALPGLPFSILTAPRPTSLFHSALRLFTFGATLLLAAFSLGDTFAQSRVNLAKYQRAVSSSQNSTFDAEFAFDGLVSNFHSFRTGNVAAPHWLEISYPLSVTLASAHLYLGALDSATPTLLPANFKFQYHNGLTWIDVPGSSVSANTAVELAVTFSQPVTSDRFRFYCTDTGIRAVRELALFPPNRVDHVEQGYPLGTDVRLNLAYLRPATSSSAAVTNTYGPGYAKNAFDGYLDNTSRWIGTSAIGEWIEVELGALPKKLDATATGPSPLAVQIGSAHVYSGFMDANRVSGQPLSDFKLQSWDATNFTWVDIPGATIVGNTQAALEIPFTEPVTTSNVRLIITNVASPARLQELLLFPPNTSASALGREVLNTPPPAYRFTGYASSLPVYANTWDTYSDSTYRLRNRGPDLRLGLVGGKVTYASPGTPVSTDLEWQLLLNIRDGSYRIRHPRTGLCLALESVSTAAGTPVVAQTYSGLPHQDWLIAPDPADATRFRLVNVYSGLVLQSLNDSWSAGAAVVVQPAVDGLALQFWSSSFQRHHPKKGIAGTNSIIANSANPYTSDPTLTFVRDYYNRFGGSWTYTWGRQLSEVFPFMETHHSLNPMQWGNGNNNFFRDPSNVGQGPIDRNLVDFQSNAKPMHLMGYNEPEHEEQANVTVAAAIARWPRLEALQAPLVGPCPASPEGPWQDEFFSLANARGYRRDYTPVHWYGSPGALNAGNANGLITVLERIYNTYGRPIWLTEFSTVRWSGTAAWTDGDNFNFLAEFMWRAESLPWLKRYSLFAFIEASASVNQSSPDPAEAPRSNAIRPDGTLTAFGELYAGWDGVTSVVNHRAYHLHNRGGYERIQNPGGTANHTLINPDATSANTGTQWFLTPGATANTVRILSTRDGRPLRTANGTSVTLGTVGQSDSSVEWRFVASQYGVYFIEHPATNKRLRENGTTCSLEAVTQTGTAFQWRFVAPAVAEAAGPPSTPTGLVATATPSSVTLNWSAATNANAYTVQRATTAAGPWTTLATDVAATEWTDSGLSASQTYFYQIIATNLFALSSAPSPVASATTPTPYAAWVSTRLATVPSADQLPTADPDRDGFSNLLEYAIDTNPTTPTAAHAQHSLDAESKLQLTFLRARSELTYEVLASSDLTTWTVLATDPGTVGTSVTVTDSVSLTTAGRRFLRLRVTSAP